MKMKTITIKDKKGEVSSYTCYIDDINIKVDEIGLHVILKDVYNNIFNGCVNKVEVK